MVAFVFVASQNTYQYSITIENNYSMQIESFLFLGAKYNFESLLIKYNFRIIGFKVGYLSLMWYLTLNKLICKNHQSHHMPSEILLPNVIFQFDQISSEVKRESILSR